MISSLTALACALLTQGAENPPVQLGLVVMLRVVTYDSSFASRGPPGDFVLLVPTSDEASARALTKDLDAVSAAKVSGRRVRLKAVQMGATAELAQASGVVFIRGLRRAEVAPWAREASQRRLYTLSLDPELMGNASMIGVETEAGKLKVLLSRSLAAQAGLELPPAVYKVVKVVR